MENDSVSLEKNCFSNPFCTTDAIVQNNNEAQACMMVWASSLLIAKMFFFQQEENNCAQSEITLPPIKWCALLWCHGRIWQWLKYTQNTYRGVFVWFLSFFTGKAIFNDMKGKWGCEIENQGLLLIFRVEWWSLVTPCVLHSVEYIPLGVWSSKDVSLSQPLCYFACASSYTSISAGM